MNDTSASIFMRVLLCKIHCPTFICFCKPTVVAAHIYNPGPLKLENTPHVPPPTTASSAADTAIDAAADGDEVDDDGQFSVKSNIESKEETADGNQESHEVVALKSCLRKLPAPESGNPADDGKDVGKKEKKVRWIDNLGKQLVEIREFESSERDSDNEMENRTCVCTIL